MIQTGVPRAALGWAGQQSSPTSARAPCRAGTELPSLWALGELPGGAGEAGEVEIQGEIKGLALLKFSSFVVFILEEPLFFVIVTKLMIVFEMSLCLLCLSELPEEEFHKLQVLI